MIYKPARTEYTDAYQSYIDLVPSGDLCAILRSQGVRLREVFDTYHPTFCDYQYAPGKWTIRQVLMHLLNSERIMQFKAFVTLRNDSTTVLYHPDREWYLGHSNLENRTIADILAEFDVVRSATVLLFEKATPEQLNFIGQHALPVHALSARAIGFAMAGHVLHHLQVVVERYGMPEDSAG